MATEEAENVTDRLDYRDRNSDSVACLCGGYADRVKCTSEEIKRYGCGRNFECCARAFVCRVCKKRLVGTAPAPEME